MIYLTIKVGLLSVLFIITIISRKKKFGNFDFVTVLLSLNIIFLCGLYAWEVGTKYIFGFFIMNFLSNYINFMSFYMVIYQMRTPEHEDMVKRVRWYVITGHIIYGGILIAACIPRFGPYCRSDKLYPPVLSWSEIL
jgi:hypothetical protein